MRQVTSEKWAEFITQYRYMCVGSGNDTMKIWDIPSREIIGAVEYFPDGGVRYYIIPDTKAKVSYVQS